VFKTLFDIVSKDSTLKSEAASYLQKYVALKPSDAEAQKNLGDMLYDLKNTFGALAAYRAAIVADPAIKGFYKRYVELVLLKGTPDELVKALTGAINAQEADAAMYSSLGAVYQKQGNCAKPSTCTRSRSSSTRRTSPLFRALRSAGENRQDQRGGDFLRADGCHERQGRGRTQGTRRPVRPAEKSGPSRGHVQEIPCQETG